MENQVQEVLSPPRERPGLHRRLYNWVLSWADSPWGMAALFALALAESSFFPIPPDPLLMALALGRRARSFTYATACSFASVVGGIFGYLIGAFLWDTVRDLCFTYIFSEEMFNYVGGLYNEYDFLAVFIAGFTPIPYKVFTIAGGVFRISFPTFVLASAISRSARFFLVAGLIYIFGPPIRSFIDRYFNLLSILFVILLALGFLAFKFVL